MKTITLDVQTPFAHSKLLISGFSGDAELRSAKPHKVNLPDGMNVNECLLGGVDLSLAEGESFTFKCELEPEAGWEMGPDSGQWMDAYSFYNSDDHHGCICVRDPDFFENRFPVKVNGSSRSVLEPSTIEATEAHLFRLEIAAAWLLEKPTPSNEAGPWFAVDNALKF